MDGYDTLHHVGVTLDEFGSLSNDLVDAAAIGLVIKVSGEAAFPAPMADLNMINKAYVCPYSVVLTSNFEDLGVKGILRNEGAFARRFVRVRLAVKPEAVVPGTMRIRPELLVDIDLDANHWTGHVDVDMTLTAESPNWKTIASFTTVRELMNIIRPIALRKFKIGESMAESNQRVTTSLDAALL